MSNSLDKIVRYYKQTDLDYRVVWHSKDNPAMHFGYYSKGESDSHCEALYYTNNVLAKTAGIKNGQKILDAGCGLGSSVFWLAENYAVDVVGISIAPNQIEQCKQRASSLALKGKTSFFEMDYTNTSFPDESFDVIWSCESLCHASMKINFYQEAYRLLKPGGKLIISDYLRTKRPLPEHQEDLLKKKWLNNWAIEDIDTPEEHQQYMKQTGFQKITIHDVSNSVRVSLRNLHEKCIRCFPIGWLLRLIRVRSDVQHGNLVGSIYQYKAFQKKLWFYAVISATKK